MTTSCAANARAEYLPTQGRRAPSAQSILDEPPALHHGRNALALPAEHAEIFERIAIDHDQVCIGAARDGAQPASHAEHFGADTGGAGDDLPGRQRAVADRELFRLAAMHLAEQIGAVRHL